MFCLASAGLERADHAVLVDEVADHVNTMLRALDRLEPHGFAFPNRRVTILATDACAALGDRVAGAVAHGAVARAPLDHAYYSGGLRYQISVGAPDQECPIADGGAFDWVATLLSNRKAVYVASGFGSQLAAVLFQARPPA